MFHIQIFTRTLNYRDRATMCKGANRGKRRHTVVTIYIYNLNKMLVTLEFPKWQSKITCIVVGKRTTYPHTYSQRHDTVPRHTVRRVRIMLTCTLLKKKFHKVLFSSYCCLSQFSHEAMTFIFFLSTTEFFTVHSFSVSTM